jgi:hypothetical protein
MSMDTEIRECNRCSYRLVLHEISDAHGGGGLEFVAPPRKGDDVRSWTAVENCPECEAPLSRESTTKIND